MASKEPSNDTLSVPCSNSSKLSIPSDISKQSRQEGEEKMVSSGISDDDVDQIVKMKKQGKNVRKSN